MKIQLFLLSIFSCIMTLKSQNIDGVSITKKTALEQLIKQNKPLHLLVEGQIDSIKKNSSSYNINIKYNYDKISALIIPAQKIKAFIENHKQIGITKLGFNSDKGIVLSDLVMINNNIDSVQKGLGELVQGYDGTDVVIGFIDTGIDFNHPDFKNNDGSSRIKYIWDQKQSIAGKAPLPYQYGTQWSNLDIDTKKCSHDDEPYFNGHGTHVAGVASGNGNAINNFRGVAPKSDIIAVACNLDAPNFSEMVADAVHYIFSTADSMGKPCVINTSVGTMHGNHEAKDLASLLIEKLVNEKNSRALVAAGGNSGNVKLHLSYAVNKDTSFTYFGYNNLINLPDLCPSGGVFFELFADSSMLSQVNFSIGIDRDKPLQRFMSTPYFNIKNRLNKIYSDTLKKENEDQIAIIHTWAEQNDGKYLLQVLINPDSIENFKWKLSATGSGQFDIWSNRALMGTSDIETNSSSVSDFPDLKYYKQPDNQKTIMGSWACAPSVLTVGSYVNKNSYTDLNGMLNTLPEVPGSLAGNSSMGPTLDGRLKPEITASGTNVFSCGRLATLEGWKKTNASKVAYGGFHYRNSGSSVAAAVVSGIIALYFQKCPNISFSEVKSALLNTANSDNFTGKVPNQNWGYGKINAMKALSISDFKTEIFNSGNNTICQGDSLILSGSAGFKNYAWNNGEKNKSILVRESGSYNLMVENEKGCKSRSQTISITAKQSPEKPSIIQSGNILLSSNGNFYQWYLDYQPIEKATNQFFEAKTNGVYTVKVISNNFCGTMSDPVVINNTSVVNNQKTIKSILNPNPFRNKFTFNPSSEIKDEFSIQIFNSSGELIHTENNLIPHSEINVDLELFPNGIYLISIVVDGKTTENYKVIKQ